MIVDIVTLDELTRLTKRTAVIAERLLHIARHSQTLADGLVIQTQLVVLEHDVADLVNVVQLRAIKEYTVARPPARAPRIRTRPLSTAFPQTAPVRSFDMRGVARES